MAKALAVIGSGWGDEGKGLMVDNLARAGGVVARTNGGAQARHTVQRPGGARHVFSHFGSGTLRGAATFLTRYFVHSPLLMRAELRALGALGIYNPIILADPNGQVTTPWDAMINQIAEEESCGAGRHGSCGIGFNETIRRGLDSPWRIRVMDLAGAENLRRIARAIQTEWVPAQLAALGFEPSALWRQRLEEPGILNNFTTAAAEFRQVTALDDGSAAIAAAHQGALIFEGAQGLLLDEGHRFFPYVTHSKTGLPNMGVLAREWGLESIDAVYVTRAYATRHGAGPFPREATNLAYSDATNTPNMWQGSLRYGELDLDLLAATITADLATAGIPVEHQLAVTCLDQVGSSPTWWQEGRRVSGTQTDLVQAVMNVVGSKCGFTSFGPCREDVTAFRPRMWA